MAKKVIDNIIRASTGGEKLEFPYTLPPIKVELEPRARQTILLSVSILATSIILASVFFSKRK